MTELLTAAQMRAIEQAAIDSGEVTGLELMERAGRGVVEAIFEEWPELAKAPHRAVVLCGPGNNGGDGFVVARVLKEWGWEVEVFLYGDPEKLPPDSRVNYERWGEIGEVKAWSLDAFDVLRRADILIDAVFGTGLKRPLPSDVEDGFAILRGASRKPYAKRYRRAVAVDVPSGLDSDSGKLLDSGKGNHLQARLTVTFCMRKVGHLLHDGPFHCEELMVKALGLRREEFLERSPFEEVADERRVRLFDWKLYGMRTPFMKQLDKWHGDHKYTHGHALILTGGPGHTGAARLAARGALRIGAGLVTLGCPQNALSEVAAQTTAIMCRPLDGVPGLREMLEDDRLNALCLGPGLGLGPDTQQLTLEALKAKRATVLDADALTRFERFPDLLFDALHENCVLTPHTGEFRRLFPDIAEKLDAPATKGPAYSKVDATREAAARASCTVLFKGPDTVIADPSGACSINASVYDRAAPWLATAGSGDVLAGFITGLLARGFAPMQAAETAAWLHTECALSFGPGLIAEDLPEELPKVFATLFDAE